MDNGITWVGMDVHKESIVVTAVSHDSDRAPASGQGSAIEAAAKRYG